MDVNFNLLKDFIGHYLSLKKDKIVAITTLDDLGMFGNDKYDFLIDYSKKFNVDISNLKYDLYIEPEPSLIMHLDNFSRFLFNKKLTNKYDVKTISVEMLVSSMEKGKWIEY